jgi:hypothetical protein
VLFFVSGIHSEINESIISLNLLTLESNEMIYLDFKVIKSIFSMNILGVRKESMFVLVLGRLNSTSYETCTSTSVSLCHTISEASPKSIYYYIPRYFKFFSFLFFIFLH